MKVVFESEPEVVKITKGKYIIRATSIEPMKMEWSIGGNSVEEAQAKWDKTFKGCEITIKNTSKL